MFIVYWTEFWRLCKYIFLIGVVSCSLPCFTTTLNNCNYFLMIKNVSWKQIVVNISSYYHKFVKIRKHVNIFYLYKLDNFLYNIILVDIFYFIYFFKNKSKSSVNINLFLFFLPQSINVANKFFNIFKNDLKLVRFIIP